VPIVDVVFLSAAQTRQYFLLSLAVPHFDRFGVDPGLHPLADQSGRQRIDVSLHRDRASRLHPHLDLSTRLEAPSRQRLQPLLLFFDPLLSFGVAAFTHFPQEGPIGFPIGKIPAAAQQQRLFHRSFEAMMALFGVAVLVTLARIDRLGSNSVVRHHRFIAAREKLGPRGLHRQTHAIAAMVGRHAAQGPHRVLEPFAKTLETLRKTKGHVFPVRVRQHEVVHQVRERFAVDRRAQIGHVREVRGAQLARHMLLREEHLLVRPARGPPVFDPPLECPQLPRGKSPRITALQFFEERLGFPARALFEQGFDFAPHALERIGTRAPNSIGRLLGQLRRQRAARAILPCCLAIHACLRRRQRQRRLLAKPGP
jgi:hypothetical protein